MRTRTTMPEGTRYQARYRDDQRQRPPGSRDGSDPVRSRPGRYHAAEYLAQLYTDSLVDVSDVAEEIGRTQGGYHDTQRILATVGSKWIGVPWAVGGGFVIYRKSWLWEAAAEKFQRPLVIHLVRLGHTFGDAPGWWYPYPWSWGGKEVAEHL